MNLSAYWDAYDATLVRVRADKPDTFAALKAILDRFHGPSSGDAFFPGGADDDLADALHDAGWELRFTEGVYVYTARHPRTGAKLQHVEGDIYDQSPDRPAMTAPGARITLVSHVDPHSTLLPGEPGTVEAVDDAGTVHVLWDNGSRLGLIAGLDRWAPLHPRWDSQDMVDGSAPASEAVTDAKEDDR